MVQSLRVFAIVAVMVFAAVGCQKGTKSAAKGEAESGEASTGTEGSETQAKTGEASTEAGKSSTEARKSSDAHTTDASKGSSQVRTKGTLTEVDDGALVDLRVGQVLTVVLDSNHAAGLSWTMAKPTATVIVPEGKPVYALKSGKVAAEESPGTETWRFRAAKRGEQTVRLEYQRGMGQSVAERRFGFTATVR